MSLFLITSIRGGDIFLFLNEGVFLKVRDLSLRDLEVLFPLLYRLLGDFELVSGFGIERCSGYYGDIYSLFLSLINSSLVLTTEA